MEDAGYGRPNRQILTSKLKDLYQGFLSEGLGMAPAPSFVSRNYQIDDEVVVFERAVQEKYEPDYLYDFIDVDDHNVIALCYKDGIDSLARPIYRMNILSPETVLEKCEEI